MRSITATSPSSLDTRNTATRAKNPKKNPKTATVAVQLNHHCRRRSNSITHSVPQTTKGGQPPMDEPRQPETTEEHLAAILDVLICMDSAIHRIEEAVTAESEERRTA